MAILLPYQQRWADDGARFKIGMLARQTGKTFTTTLEIAEDCLAAEVAGRAARWVILSRGERQAGEAMGALKLHLRALGAAFEALEYDHPGAEASYKAMEVTFPGGSRVTALPANPDTARGYSANVFLDEFAFHRDSREIWKALFPVISRPDLKLRITSTPNGKGNKFYELMTSADDAWSRHTVTIHQAVAEGLERDIGELRAGIGDEDAWRQEYELEWLDEADAWLSYDLITACEDDKAGRPELYRGGPCFVGNDIAASGSDLWVAWVLEEMGDVLWTREIVELKRATFAEHDRVMDDIFRRYKVARAGLDQTGMGEKPVEDARRRYGKARVEGVRFTPAAKLDLAIAAKQAFEDRKLRIPAGNVVLRADLHKIKKVLGPTGIPRLIAERDGDGHADRAWACALAIAAAGTGVTEYAYTPAHRGGADRRGDDDDDHPGERPSGLRGMKGTW